MMIGQGSNSARALARGTRRDEKLSVLAALLGDETMQHLRSREEGFDPEKGACAPPGSDRLAWHRNTLLERLRARASGAPSSRREDGSAQTRSGDASAGADTPHGERQKPRVRAKTLEARIRAGVQLETLASEHPTVIVCVLRGLDREARIAAIRRLPGRTARAVLHRMKTTSSNP